MNILFYTAGEDTELWTAALRKALPDARVTVWPPSAAAIDYAVVWKPPAKLVAGLTPVRAVFNLGAGVDAVAELAWPSGIPLVRLVDAGMAEQMTEYVAYAVLRRYREFTDYEEAQRESRWQQRARLDKSLFNVGILGMGVLGSAAAETLLSLGFPVTGWSRMGKGLPGVRMFARGDLDAFLATCRILVCLLPLTRDTRGLLDRRALSGLPRGAYVVNVARGALLVDADLIALLDAGHISGAMLDVFRDEPLAPGHAFWHHPRISVTPHVSAVTQIGASVAQVAANIRRLEEGLPVPGVVDRVHGY